MSGLVDLIANTSAWGAVVLGAMEIMRRPAPFLCDCPALGLPIPHLKSLWLFVAGAGWGVAAILAMARADSMWDRPWAAANAGLAAWHLYRWWKHSKSDRRRLMDRALGVVRATAAGLKVVFIPPTAGR